MFPISPAKALLQLAKRRRWTAVVLIAVAAIPTWAAPKASPTPVGALGNCAELMHIVTIAQLLALLSLANGSPVIAKTLFGATWARPLDGNAVFWDGRPLFGPSKTIRGVLVSLLVTMSGAPAVGLDFRIGLLVAATAMIGDLLSSFLKRRLGLAPSGKATGLDQIPESLFPLLASRSALSLSWVDIIVCCLLFFVGEVLISRVFFGLHLRDRPY